MNITIFEGFDSVNKISIRYHPDYANVLEGHIVLQDQNKNMVYVDEGKLYAMLKSYFDEIVGENHG